MSEVALATIAPTREAILRLEDAMRELPQVEYELRHTFIPGVYVREMRIRKGSALVGKLHKQEHVFIISQGDVTVVSEEGSERLQAPFQMVSRPGAKRAMYAHENTVILTVHRSDETDLEKLESQLIAKDYAELEAPLESLE